MGALVGMSLVQGGSGYPFFAPSTFAYLCGEDPCTITVNENEVPSKEVCLTLEKVCFPIIMVCRRTVALFFFLYMNQITAVGSDIPKLRECALDACDMLTACGFTKPIATLVEDDVCQLIKCVTLHSTIFQIKAELDQFIQGLSDAGVLEMLQNHAHLLQSFFVYSPQLLTAGLVFIVRMNGHIQLSFCSSTGWSV